MKRALIALVAMSVPLLGGQVRADVKAGDVITAQNVDKVKDLISPGLEWCVKQGMPDHHRRDEADRVAEGVQGGDREVRGAGEARAPTA